MPASANRRESRRARTLRYVERSCQVFNVLETVDFRFLIGLKIILVTMGTQGLEFYVPILVQFMCYENTHY